ncbi:F-box/WD repeat-containing protein 7-like [Dysidea avara]|uniref:F-box/WD repeat-containing protein 7-like n=1 Tax=Dysidea avara TaxID=196820 RepID=UPI0033292A15
MFRSRSASAPPVTLCFVSADVTSRSRSRNTNVTYERNVDQLTSHLATWSNAEMLTILESLVGRCHLNQLEFLWTTLEPVIHRDFHQAMKIVDPGRPYTPMSTPASRETRSRLQSSRNKRKNQLFLAQSAIVCSEEDARNLIDENNVCDQRSRISSSQSESSIARLITNKEPLSLSKTLPILPASPPLPVQSQVVRRGRTQSGCVTGRRTISAQRRHVQAAVHQQINAFDTDNIVLPYTGTPLGMSRSCCTTPILYDSDNFTAPEISQFLCWFGNLQRDNEQQEILELILRSLSVAELYYLRALLMLRQYRDYIANLPEHLSCRILKLIPAKDLFLACRVSKAWNARASSGEVWMNKCHTNRMGLPLQVRTTWKNLYLDDLRLKRNWRKGKCIVTKLTGHTNNVTCVKIKDTTIATGSSDRTIRIWDLDTMRSTRTLVGHQRGVWCLNFYGLNLLISGSHDHSLKIWNILTGVCERTLAYHTAPVWSLQQKKDILISGSHDKTAVVWDIRHCKLKQQLVGHDGAVFAVDLDEKAKIAYTGSGDKTIRQWDIHSGRCIRIIKASKTDPILSLHLQQGYLVCAAGMVITLWSANGAKKIKQFHGHENRVETVQLKVYEDDYKHNIILSSSKDCKIKYWNTKTGRCIRTLSGHLDPLNCVQCNDILIASTSTNGCVRIWNFDPHALLYSCSTLHNYS